MDGEMTIAIIILAYVANVFLNRWLNKIVFKIDEDYVIIPNIWFVPVVVTIAFLVIIIKEKNKPETNWFTGKYWRK
jgi:hypothetical protein